MPSTIQTIRFAGEELGLLADRALHWPARQTLIVADVHLGKDASFRVAGLPVPAGNSRKDLARLDVLLDQTGSTRLVVLGDLVHGRTSHQTELAAAFGTWRQARNLSGILLIRGNHDRHAGPPPTTWEIQEVSEPFREGPFTFAHQPQPIDEPQLCGHIHPVVSIRDFDRSFTSIPCFVVEHTKLTLPSFGSFTGGYKVDRAEGRALFAATGKSIVAVR